MQTRRAEKLFGDDAERDAFVYMLYGELLAERVPPDILEEVLDIAGVYPDCREAIYSALNALDPCDPVERIIIHLDRKLRHLLRRIWSSGRTGLQLLPGCPRAVQRWATPGETVLETVSG